MKILAHRGFYGCTDIGYEHLSRTDAKGENLPQLPPENSLESITAAFEHGFGVETDVVMTFDRELVMTHTNELALHSSDAQRDDFASGMALSQIKRMKTGKGGRQAEFLIYDEFLACLKKYENLTVNVEIKGNIHPQRQTAELTAPTIVEKLAEKTPDNLMARIIWSSFSLSHLAEMHKLRPQAEVAPLFYPQNAPETKIYTDKDDIFMQFTIENVQKILKFIPDLRAVHPCIDSLANQNTIEFCVERGMTIRPWVLQECNPLKNEKSRETVLQIKALQKQYPHLKIDMITDFAQEVKSLLDK